MWSFITYIVIGLAILSALQRPCEDLDIMHRHAYGGIMSSIAISVCYVLFWPLTAFVYIVLYLLELREKK